MGSFACQFRICASTNQSCCLFELGASEALVQAELQKEVAKEKALAEGRARALEHRENRDIFMQEIAQQATEWGKQ